MEAENDTRVQRWATLVVNRYHACAMSADALEDFGRAIQSAFYEDEGEAFRAALAAEEAAAAGALRRATGIDDADLLVRLAELGVRPETLAALTLIPLIETAWADGVMDPKERDAVLSGAVSSGIAEDSASYRLLEIWTIERPAPGLSQAWHEYIAALSASLSASERASLRAKIIGRARRVAEAAGRLLHSAPDVSAEERAVLDAMGASFGEHA